MNSCGSRYEHFIVIHAMFGLSVKVTEWQWLHCVFVYLQSMFERIFEKYHFFSSEYFHFYKLKKSSVHNAWACFRHEYMKTTLHTDAGLSFIRHL